MVYCLKTGCIVDSIVIIIVDPIKAHQPCHATLLFTIYIATSGEISCDFPAPLQSDQH